MNFKWIFNKIARMMQMKNKISSKPPTTQEKFDIEGLRKDLYEMDERDKGLIEASKKVLKDRLKGKLEGYPKIDFK